MNLLELFVKLPKAPTGKVMRRLLKEGGEQGPTRGEGSE